MKKYDLCVIGAGAAGLAAAITAAGKGMSVLVLDKNNKPCKKIYATGNGRCNITNKNIDISKHYSSDCKAYSDFLISVMGASPYQSIKDFLDSLGILTHSINDYVYPASMQASSLCWTMLDACRRLNVDIIQNEEITHIEKLSSHFNIVMKNEDITAPKLILACGGASYSRLGGTKSGYMLAESLGHSIKAIRPALCGLVTAEDTSPINGVRAGGRARLISNKSDIIAEESGELQFTDYGLSGIMIFNLSSKTGKLLRDGLSAFIEINFLYGLESETAINTKALIDSNLHRNLMGMLNSMVNDKLAGYILDRLNMDRKALVRDTDMEDIKKLIYSLSHMRFNITSLKDYENAQVTAGGVDISEIEAYNCRSKLVNNLYIAGEMLDIDGLCGGYNLTFAILSGIAAGKGAYDTN